MKLDHLHRDEDGRSYKPSKVTPTEADRERVRDLEPVQWKLGDDGSVTLVYRKTRV